MLISASLSFLSSLWAFERSWLLPWERRRWRWRHTERWTILGPVGGSSMLEELRDHLMMIYILWWSVSLCVCLSRKIITSSWESPVTTWFTHNHRVQLQVSFDGSRLVFHGSMSVFIGFQGFGLVFHFSRFLGFSRWDLRVNHGPRLAFEITSRFFSYRPVFHGSRWFFMFFLWLQVWFSWFQVDFYCH